MTDGGVDDPPISGEWNWWYEKKKKTGKVLPAFPKSKFTMDLKKGNPKMCCGWNQEGLCTFNDLLKKIKEDCMQNPN